MKTVQEMKHYYHSDEFHRKHYLSLEGRVSKVETKPQVINLVWDVQRFIKTMRNAYADSPTCQFLADEAEKEILGRLQALYGYMPIKKEL